MTNKRKRLSHTEARALRAQAHVMMDAGQSNREIAKKLNVPVHRIHVYSWERRKNGWKAPLSKPVSVAAPASPVTTVTPTGHNPTMFLIYGPTIPSPGARLFMANGTEDTILRSLMDHLIQMRAK